MPIATQQLALHPGHPTPPLKWVGGKRQLVSAFLPLLPATCKRYIEPFFGGGALFWALCPQNALLSDANPDLMAFYRQVQEDPEVFTPILARWGLKKADFYRIRSMRGEDIPDQATRAARMLYLNKIGFNGLWRVNASGECNMSYGRDEQKEFTLPHSQVKFRKKMISIDNMHAASKALSSAWISCVDYQETCSHAEAGDFVYLDPPYLAPPRSPTPFTTYTAQDFRVEDHQQLARTIHDMSQRGVYVMLSMVDDGGFTRALYPDLFCTEVLASRNLNPMRGRKPVKELVLCTYPPAKEESHAA